MMYEYFLTVGLNDKDSLKQEIPTDAAKNTIAEILINDFEIFAFTMIDCEGVYKMESNGKIIREKSVRIEIAADENLTKETVLKIIGKLKTALNQESIMMKMCKSNIDFI